MFWEKNFAKLGWAGVIFIGICTILFIILFLSCIELIRIRVQPIQKESVQVLIKKDTYNDILGSRTGGNPRNYSVIFAFPDGSEKGLESIVLFTMPYKKVTE